jgi:hypothetical protein
MGPRSRHFSVRTRDPRWVQDWFDAEIVERIEAIEAQIAILDVARAEIETEFFMRIEMIEAQVESLDNERDWLEMDLSGPESETSSGLYLQQPDRQGEKVEPTLIAHEHEAQSEWLIRTPMSGQTLALLVTLVLGPWILIGAVVWLLVRY